MYNKKNNKDMRTKRLFYSLMITGLLAVVVMVGCQQDEVFDFVKPSTNEFKGGPYLDAEIPANEGQMTSEEINIVMQGILRVGFQKDADGYYEIPECSAADVNMSERLFSFVVTLIERANDRIYSDFSSIKKVKTRSEKDDEEDYSDCVARCIAYSMNMDYNSVNSWIEDQYGDDGVPVKNFFDTMKHFNEKGEQISVLDFPSLTETKKEEANKYIIVIESVHAVVLQWKSSESDVLLYYDPQVNKVNYCEVSKVTHIYKVNII